MVKLYKNSNSLLTYIGSPGYRTAASYGAGAKQ